MKLIHVLVAATLAGSVAARCLADTPPPPPPPPPAAGAPEACKEDVQRLCAGVTPGEGRIKECMKAHAKELSASCKQSIREKRRAKAASGEAPPGPPPSSPPPAAPPPGTSPPPAAPPPQS